MSDDDTIIEQEDLPQPVEGDEDNAAIKAKPRRSKPRLLLPVLGVIMAMAAGGVGGFISHEYFDAPPPPPNIPNYKAQILELDKAVKAQEARSARFQQQLKTVSAELDSDLTALDERWAQQLSALTQGVVDKTEAVDIEAPSAPALEPRVNHDTSELLNHVAHLRQDVGHDIDRIKARLDILEHVAEPRPDHAGLPAKTSADFPVDDILGQLNGPTPPKGKPRWYDKFLDQHVSLERTDHDKSAALLHRIEAAILRGDWDAAVDLSQELDEPARRHTQEWIAGARP